MAAEGYGESRVAHFTDGAHGGDSLGSQMHLATSIQQGVPAEFSPGSVLQLPNVIRTANGMSSGTYQRALPMMSWMRQTTMSDGGNGVMNV